jgi:hypothetical protein
VEINLERRKEIGGVKLDLSQRCTSAFQEFTALVSKQQNKRLAKKVYGVLPSTWIPEMGSLELPGQERKPRHARTGR